ncbi:MAG: hypothetical protein SO297_02080 [Clostridium paraputrificum]|nr:hypothetical protein [Clostridium paraputrificum]MDY4720715.1 hypothetical protein [Clostridium paraputrificum]
MINEIINSGLISNLLGVIIGGVITYFVTNKHEKKRLKSELKLDLWKKIIPDLEKYNKCIGNINLYIINCELGYNSNKKIYEEKTICLLKKEMFKMNESIINIESLINIYEPLIIKKEIIKSIKKESNKFFDIIGRIEMYGENFNLQNMKNQIDLLTKKNTEFNKLIQEEFLNKIM